MRQRRPTAIVASTIPLTLDRFHRELIRQLARHHDVHIVSSPGTGLSNLARDLPVVTHSITMRRYISPVADLRALIRWVRLIRRFRPHVMVTATPKASLLGQLAARLTGVPDRLYYVGGLRLEGAEGFERWVLTLVERLTCYAATAVVANSASLHQLIQDLRLAPAHKLHRTQPGSSHGVDAAYYSPQEPDLELAASLGLDLSLPVAGFVGRLTRDKGVHVLAEALVRLCQQGVQVQLLVVGPQDEPDSAGCLQSLRDTGTTVADVMHVDDVRPYYALMSVHVLPSLREGFPNVVLEAAAMGVPSISTDATGAIDSVISNVTGLTVAAGDSSALAVSMERLLGSPQHQRQLGTAARDWVLREFKTADVVSSLLRPIMPLGDATGSRDYETPA